SSHAQCCRSKRPSSAHANQARPQLGKRSHTRHPWTAILRRLGGVPLIGCPSAPYSASGSFFSSIAMSFNSLDSKTSPHSWHSTYSDSSSRETICTRGCLHCSGLTFFCGECDGWLCVINLSTIQLLSGNGRFPQIFDILRRLAKDVKYP